MTLPIPLEVRLSNTRLDRHITRDLRSLTFRSVAPGGFASATFTLDRPLVTQPDEIGYFTRVYIVDARNGATPWEGRLQDPGRSAGADGEIWELSAVGPSAHARDRRVPLIYIDQSWERWRRLDFSQASPAVKNDDTKRSTNVPSFTISATSGASYDIGEFISGRRYEAIQAAGMALGRVECLVDNGATATQFSNKLVTRADGGSSHVVEDLNWDTTSALLAGAVGAGTPITNGDNIAELRADRDDGTAWSASSGGVPINTRWAEFWFPVVRCRLMNADGTDITSGYSATSVLASEVVKDLVGRLLDQYDGVNATIATTGYAIEQLVYPDGTTPADVLDDLMLFEPGYYWAAWESDPTTGKYRFEWKAWPTTVRYLADVLDGYSAPSSAVELFNKVTVVGKDSEGLTKKVTRTQTVPELTAAGLTREELVPLADELYTTTNANRVGDMFLAEHLTPLNAGSLTVARPVYDSVANRMVQPWEIRPGNLIRVSGIRPNIDSLNATDRDGVAVFRVMAVEYDAGSAAATLELDSRPRTVEHLLAKLQQKIARRG